MEMDAVYECVFFNKKLNLTFKIVKGVILVIGENSNKDSQQESNDNKDSNKDSQQESNDNKDNHNKDSHNKDNNNNNNKSQSHCLYCWHLEQKCIKSGSIVISVNGVNVSGLDKDFQLALLRNTQRPIVIRFKHPTEETRYLANNTINKSSHDNNNDNNDQTIDRLKYSVFISKYNHSLASTLRKQVESIVTDYLDCDWMEAREKNFLPQDTIISLYRYIETEMIKLGLLDNTKQQGIGVPTMTDSHWDNLREHIELFLFRKVYSYTKEIGPMLSDEISTDSKNINDSLDPDDAFEAEDIEPVSSSTTSSSWLPSSSSSTSTSKLNNSVLKRSSICSKLMMKLASLRFVGLENLGLKVKDKIYTKQSSDSVYNREEWSICVKGLTRALHQESPGLILNKLVLTLRMISHALEAYLNYPEGGAKLEYQCLECMRIRGDVNDTIVQNQFNNLENKSSTEVETLEYIKRLVHPNEINNNKFTVSADDFLPALTWTLIRANPANIETICWIASEFRHPVLLHGEESYCLSQVQSAVEWCKRVKSGASFDLDEEYYNNCLKRYEYSLQLVLACKHGDIENIVLLLNQGADVNSLTPDQRDCPLTACIRYKQKEALIQILQTPNINVNLSLFRKQTPLMVAVQNGDVDDVLRLIRKGADRHDTDDIGNTALSMALASNQENIAQILRTESRDINILQCIRQDSKGNQTQSGILMTLFLQDISGVNKLYDDDMVSPLQLAVRLKRVHIIKVLLTIGNADVNMKNIKGKSISSFNISPIPNIS